MKRICLFYICCLLLISEQLLCADYQVFGSLNSYISTDFHEYSGHKQDRTNEVCNSMKGIFGINEASIGLQADGKNYYGRVSLQLGNFQNEFRNNNDYLQDAYVGYKINKNISIDGGYFLSESAEMILDNRFNSQQWVNYYLPVNHAGIRLNYRKKDFEFGFSVLNSIYDRNSRTGNLAFSPSVKYDYNNGMIKINLQGIYGNEVYGDYEVFQMYNILKTEVALLEHLFGGFEFVNFVAGAEPVLRAKPKTLNNINIWLSGNFLSDFTASVRFSVLNNHSNLWNLPAQINPDAALSIEYKPSKKSFIRLEVRDIFLDGERRNDFFINEEMPVNYRTDVSINFGFYLIKLVN
ncbi:MAG: hypothetical protein KIT33_10075 [Candidatus Kapabacteria bacterium]|nr:hypothetical protein [Ignavibacteriota bacterium]MCW5885304.1 hypothetical protein [Candidatus Kapabacteria bacterium]